MSKEKEIPDHTIHVQELFIEHVSGLKYFILSMLPDPDEAQDIVQETFITITTKAQEFQLGSNFKAWAYTIARFKVLEAYKRKKRDANRLSDSVIELLAAEAEEFDKDTSASDALKNCLKELSPKVSKMIELRYQKGLKPSKIAEHIGWTAEAVYVALSRTRTTLKGCIEKNLVGQKV
jgi:RNA polymerase sigma-70 factor, ECF subfamily